MIPFLEAQGWKVVHDQTLEAFEGQYRDPHTLPLGEPALRVLRGLERGLYTHQHEALRRSASGEHLCLATATASGKSLVFYAAAADILAREPEACVLALYPLKALASEQEQRWNTALARSGLEAKAERIDGSVPMARRRDLLRRAGVLIATPDVLHAWLFSNLAEPTVRSFLSRLRLVVVDEAHTYTGVFGSNAAYLFRRLNHAATLLGALPRYIAASATIREPVEHLSQLTGLPFSVIGPEQDGSQRFPRRILLAEPPSTVDFTTAFSGLLSHAADEGERFIAFVDSRKQTELVASVMARREAPESDGTADPDGTSEPNELPGIDGLHVLPYRAGYEEDDRSRIQQRLNDGALRGVVSTSALELGMDISGLTLAVLRGVPPSQTSFVQRIGRVGRHGPGTVLIVDDGSVRSRFVFREPEALLQLPPAESALYLENPRIQYMHALCLARLGGEHDQVAGRLEAEGQFALAIDVPASFISLCEAERRGEVPAELQALKGQGGEDPHHAFPLRDCEVSFAVSARRGPEMQRLGTLSQSQVMREAYPGAVYYYQTRPYRVVKVKVRSREIAVRQEKHYQTRPTVLPAMIFPNLTEGNVHTALKSGGLRAIESVLQVREALAGYTERRGPNEFTVAYPLDPANGLFFDQPRFVRNYFSTGITLTHPALNGEGVSTDAVAAMIYEAFLLTIPFERQEVQVGCDRHRASRLGVHEGERFIAVYDSTYGSLRLTSRLVEPEVLTAVLSRALELAEHDEHVEASEGTVRAIRAMATDAYGSFHHLAADAKVDETGEDEAAPLVIAPGSYGLNVKRDNEAFYVETIRLTPKGLIYQGRHESQKGAKFEGTVVTVRVDSVVLVPGETNLGYFDYETGEITTIHLA